MECLTRDSEKETLKDYTRIIVETDTENPVTIAEITTEKIHTASGYRVRLTPKEGEMMDEKKGNITIGVDVDLSSINKAMDTITQLNEKTQEAKTLADELASLVLNTNLEVKF